MDMVEWKKLSEVFEIKNGYTPSKNVPGYWDNGTIPWFRMEDIRLNGGILSDSIQHITPAAIKSSGLFPENTIIVATTATIGEHALVIVDSLANQQFTALTCCKSLTQSVLPRFAYYYCFKLDDWCKNHIRKGGFASVDMEGFKKYPFPIPSLSEQNRIVDILDTFTASIGNLKEQIALRRKQYEYYRDHLLDLEGKEGVEMKKLGEVTTVLRGKRLTKNMLEDDAPYPVFHGGVEPLGFYRQYNREANSVMVINVGASAGTVGYCDRQFWSSDGCFCVSHSKFINNKFLYYYLETKTHYLQSQVRHAGIPTLDNPVVEKVNIPLLPLQEQQRIVSILDTFEASIQNLEAQLSQREKQYEYYRNKLLTFE